MEAQVTKVDANGNIYANFFYSDADVVAGTNTPPEVVNAMRSQIKNLVGVSGSMMVDNQGNTKQASVNLPEGFDPNSKQMVDF
jgi:acetylornithine/succinyldiaminopimelate/putrescine aminotransferase